MMKMALPRRLHGYSKMDKEDHEERVHRRAQFFIYKVLEKADSRRKPSCVRIRMVKLKIKIGNGLRSIKKGIFSRAGFHGQFMMGQVKTLKSLMIGLRQTMKFCVC
ncbi:hypothetical protein AAZX31_18G062800 [Glycine max]|uniref:Uncharacterized protein n=1 Tax=Glycine max TaxID=3847 RepID=K7MQA2_SOYBN|nr:hypothetical protein JHK86_049402 [Glycine max]KAG4935245.1 hypothetical protein JHK85_050164 [Glycine max]KAG5090764.1 hypothetical protein JHK82_049542 [Glycine max]KAG5093852.1 hypothetical protein JHK84_049440 [Glycine max]KAH1153478.1 hypothetical protein GYH30_049215 [Glycine max]